MLDHFDELAVGQDYIGRHTFVMSGLRTPRANALGRLGSSVCRPCVCCGCSRLPFHYEDHARRAGDRHHMLT
jgi:hypothetical protein